MTIESTNLGECIIYGFLNTRGGILLWTSIVLVKLCRGLPISTALVDIGLTVILWLVGGRGGDESLGGWYWGWRIFGGI